ncbi:MAG TPA: site-specific DNA-methyltransferase [Patescibacteria group bacterium]|nr:site-specific DNA-methyltransferase [Patescibacteria group bacterium]
MIYDIFDCKVRPEKGRPRSNIYTGTGSNFEVRAGKCEDLLQALQDDSIHAIITDPPYGVKMDTWDNDMPSVEVWNLCYDKLKPGGHLAIFCQPSMLPILYARMSQTQFEFRDQLIWAFAGTHIKGIKTEDGSYGSKIRNVYNPILIYRKKLVGSELNNWSLYRTNLLNLEDTRQVYKGDHSSIVRKFEETGKGHMQSETKSNTFSKLNRTEWVPNSRGALPTNIQYCPRAAKEEKTVNNTINNPHVSVKPLGILSWLVKLLTNSSNQLVADIYCGTGSLGVVCRKLNRPFLGIEMDLETVEIAKYRIKHTFDLDDKYFNNIKPI